MFAATRRAANLIQSHIFVAKTPTQNAALRLHLRQSVGDKQKADALAVKLEQAIQAYAATQKTIERQEVEKRRIGTWRCGALERVGTIAEQLEVDLLALLPPGQTTSPWQTLGDLGRIHRGPPLVRELKAVARWARKETAREKKALRKKPGPRVGIRPALVRWTEEQFHRLELPVTKSEAGLFLKVLSLLFAEVGVETQASFRDISWLPGRY